MTEEMKLFLEDMDEQLGIMENTLLDISEGSLDDIDSEMLNKLFRAMHTMKGNAGIFGYSVIVDFAHIAESLLDELRNAKISLSPNMLELFLKVNDHSKVLVEVFTQDLELDEDQKQEHNQILLELNNYLENKGELPSPKVEAEPQTNEPIKYNINIELKDEFFVSGMDMLSIIKYLNAIGSVKKVELDDSKVPIIGEFEPTKAYIGVKILFETIEDISEIEEAFEFVIEDIILDIKQEEKAQDEVKEIEEPKEDTKKEEEFIVFKKEKKQKKEPKEEKQEEKPDFVIFKKANKKSNKKTTKKESNPNSNSSLLGNNFTLKVDSQKVDKLINQISEMVIANAKINQYSLKSEDMEFEEAVNTMSKMLDEIRDGVMNIRMVQVGDYLSKLRRIVTDNAKKIGKEISFEIIGGETELDKSVIEKISDPLVHILRNSVDHGIETPEDRKEKGKSSKGTIVLKAYPDSGSIVIEIIDDGKGIDKNQIINKAISRDLIRSDAKIEDSEVYDLIFLPGFSTASEVTDISGRGVGMDVVKRNIEDLRGTVEIDSTVDKGTHIIIRLPLTLAIIDGFLVQSGNSKYIIPLDNIKECIELKKDAKEQMKNKGYITLRSQILPILDVADYFDEKDDESKRENVVIVEYGKSQVGLKVGELFGEYQTVIKPLGDVFKNISGISGGTILGNGEVALIFDVQKLIEHKISNKES